MGAPTEVKNEAKPNELKADKKEGDAGATAAAALATKARDTTTGEQSPSEGVTMEHGAIMAERLAQEAVELAPRDPRPWQALAEACDAQGQLCIYGLVQHKCNK